MWVGKREQVDGFRLVLAIDRQTEDMLRQFWIVPGLFDLLFIRKGSLKLLVLGLGAGRSFDAVIHKPVTVVSHWRSVAQLVYRRCATTDVRCGGPEIYHEREYQGCEIDENDLRASSCTDFAFSSRVGLKIHMQGHNSRAGHKMQLQRSRGR